MFAALGFALLTHVPPLVARVDGVLASELPRLFESIGYPYDPKPDFTGEGTISNRGATVTIRVGGGGEPGIPHPPFWVGALRLSIEIPVGEDVPLHEASYKEPGFDFKPNVFTTPHLGRTVTVSQDIDIREGFDETKVRAAFDNFWKQGTAFALAHRGRFIAAPKRDWSKVRFPDGFTMDQGDLVSMVRTTASWGMKTLDPDPLDFPGTSAAVDVNGTTVYFSCGYSEGLSQNRSNSFWSVVSLPSGTDPYAWARRQNPRTKWCQFGQRVNWDVSAGRDIDMHKGVSLSELRREIIAFAANVKALKASIHAGK